MTDLMQRLAAARPTDDDLDTAWPAMDRARVLADVRQRSARPRPRSRRRTPWLAAAAVAGLCAFPIATSLGDSSAQALTELAAVAAEQSGPVLAPGTFLHVKTESVSEHSAIFDDGKTLDTNREQWVSWDGETLAIDTRPSAGWTDYMTFHPEEGPSFGSPTPEFAASLPDTAPELAAYLDANVSGSNSHEEAIFVAITDLAHSNFLPPETLSAALLVLADVDGVSVKDVEVDGRQAVEVSYAAWWARLIVDDTVTIDKETARVINVRQSDPTGSYRSDTVLTEVVSEVPADVLAAFEAHHGGERVYD